jgi:hypothetical protein
MHQFTLEAPTAMYLNRPLSDDGRYVFFDTAEALVAQDTNGERDVYEYDATTGQTYLISSGTCACESVFVDATPDGSDVFIDTHEKLVAADEGASADLYDARVNGGFAAQSTPAAAPCAGEECQPPGAASPQLLTPSSASFLGAEGQASAGQGSGGKATPRTSRRQKLAKALRACARRPRHERAKCRALARRRYGAASAKARRTGSDRRRRGGSN